MSYTPLSHVATGDTATAALHNILLDNIAIIKSGIADDGSHFGPFKGYTEKWQFVGISSGVVSANLAAGNHIVVSHSANITGFTITGFSAGVLASAEICSIFVYIIGTGTPHTIAHVINGNTVRFSNNAPPAAITSTNGYFDTFVYTTFQAVNFLGAVLQNR